MNISKILSQVRLNLEEPTSTAIITRNKLEDIIRLTLAACINEIEIYKIPVGNSAAGELACEWTYDALTKIRDNILEEFEINQQPKSTSLQLVVDNGDLK